MGVRRLLVANRGEVAIRVMRAAAGLGIETVAVHSTDDARSLHVRRGDAARALPGAGPAGYLDGEAILQVAKEEGCDAVHPGYGFLSENAGFARRCGEEDLTFVGPVVRTLELFGDKLRARELARRCGVPTLPASEPVETPEDARASLASLGSGATAIVKAVAGGGGRGMRVVRGPDELEAAVPGARSEAAAAFGDGSVYLERFVERARHIEVQIAGDRAGTVVHLGDRDCSVQRRHQKLIEVAPSPMLPGPVREQVTRAAARMAADAGYQSLGTFEFLVDPDHPAGDTGAFWFIEANPRLQVEHPVTEEVTGIDLVRLQLRLAGGALLPELGLDQDGVPRPRGFAVQARVNLETIDADGTPRPAGGTLTAFEPPTGPGIRTDTFGYAGYRTSPRFDPLLAKVIAASGSADFTDVAGMCERALSEFRIEGAATNIAFLQAILRHPDFAAGRAHTRFVNDRLAEILAADAPPRRYFEAASPPASPLDARPVRAAGGRIDPTDPLAVLEYGKAPEPHLPDSFDSPGDPTGPTDQGDPRDPADPPPGPPGTVAVTTAVPGTITRVEVTAGEPVRRDQPLVVLEAMKMEHVVTATAAGTVREVTVAVGDTVPDGSAVVYLEEAAAGAEHGAEVASADLDEIRPDLAAVLERQALTRDEARPDAVGARHSAGARTTRENIADLCDAGTFVEYGALGLPTNMTRPMAEIIRRYPADGMVTGVGAVNRSRFGDPASRTAVLAYDYTVLAGTQGAVNHRKTDRLLEQAAEQRLPVVLFTEGGGGRAGQRTETARNAHGEPMLTHVGGPGDVPTWRRLGALSGLVPLVGINSGFCFAGNAALLGCCDVIIATADSSIGMGGPALIEGGGLGVYRPEEVGPMRVQVPNGVVDVSVADEAEAVGVAKQYLSYFQGPLPDWEAADQRLLRHAVPENRLRIYDVRRVIDALADAGSVLELRPRFGVGMITALARIEGRPVGVIANNPQHLAGAIDSPGSDKAARFMKICDAFDIPILSLCDTPGIMVGPEAERTALVRHTSRMFVTSANLTVPLVAVVLRKAYGLGVLTMAAGSFKATTMTLSWPTGEFGGMGLEGQVKLGHRAELAAIDDPDQRRRRYQELVDAAYEHGKAINHGVSYGVDDVIDPADTRSIVANLFASARRPPPRDGKKRPSIDTW